MNDAPFSYVLSDDKSRLRIVPHEGVFEYTADEVLKLIEFFANVRKDMIPTTPDSAAEVRAIEADRFEALQNPQDGTAQIYSRIPGLLWSFIHLSKEQCVALAETINPQAAPHDAPRN